MRALLVGLNLCFFAQFGANANELVDAFNQLRSQEPQVRKQGETRLSAIVDALPGKDAGFVREAVPTLVSGLNDSNLSIRMEAAALMMVLTLRLDGASVLNEALPALTAATADSGQRIRQNAVLILASLKP